MTKNLMTKLMTAAIVLFLFAVQGLAEDVKSGGVTITIINPKTGSVKSGSVAAGATDDDFDAVAREMLGMPSAAEEAAAGGRQTLTLEQVRVGWTQKCLHVARFNAPGYIDAAGKLWNGVSYDGGILPVLGESNDLVKSVTRRPEGGYEVAYFRRSDLVEDFHQTDWAKGGGDYAITAEVAELCPNPAVVNAKE